MTTLVCVILGIWILIAILKKFLPSLHGINVSGCGVLLGLLGISSLMFFGSAFFSVDWKDPSEAATTGGLALVSLLVFALGVCLVIRDLRRKPDEEAAAEKDES